MQPTQNNPPIPIQRERRPSLEPDNIGTRPPDKRIIVIWKGFAVIGEWSGKLPFAIAVGGAVALGLNPAGNVPQLIYQGILAVSILAAGTWISFIRRRA